MRQSFVALALAVTIVVAGTALYTGARRDGTLTPAEASDASSPATIEHETLVSGGVTIAFTVFKPENASEASPVPVVFHSHGWSGTRAKEPTGIVGKLVEAGFGVVSVDARGHGDSGGAATVQHEDHEVKDYVALVDWVAANLPWVRKEPGTGIPNDIVAGGTGYSYAGGMQLQLAAHDPRIDAIAPEITWNDVEDSLAPNGAVKSVWVHALMGYALQSGTRVDERIEKWYREAMTSNRLPEDAQRHFRGSKPDVSRIRADVLLIQGVPDVLFNLNQAVRTYEELEEKGVADVRLFTHLTGHVVPGLQPFALDDERRATFADEGPCGSVSGSVLAWLDHHLRGGPEPGLAEISLALENGECVELDALPGETAVVTSAALPAPQAGGSVLVPVLEGPALVAGIPRLQASVTAPLGGIAHAGLVLVDAQGRSRVVDDQTMGFRLDGATLDVALSGVATRLDAGDRLLLRIDGLNEWHATNGGRVPGAAALRDVTLTIPLA